IAATFATVVDRSALIRLLPPSFGTAGTAVVVALSIFPQTLRAAGEVREAQTARGFQVRSIRDLEPLFVPVLHLGLEHAFELAESVEARGFGRRRSAQIHSSARRRAGAPAGLILAAAGVIVAGLGHLFIGCLLLATGVLLLLLVNRGVSRRRPSRYRPVFWNGFEIICTLTAAVSASLLLIALVVTSDLEYSPYPNLGWPSLDVLPLVAVVLLIIPAFVSNAPNASAAT
ncbi:MAG TPA: energy-coupling factor transporter transmembrane component T, partial [Thermomicrobiaceae bacterium]|nr:energy-coupling factor transporter transmembrane component T [Thermomicrobiaceae bacterium]